MAFFRPGSVRGEVLTRLGFCRKLSGPHSKIADYFECREMGVNFWQCLGGFALWSRGLQLTDGMKKDDGQTY